MIKSIKKGWLKAKRVIFCRESLCTRLALMLIIPLSLYFKSNDIGNAIISLLIVYYTACMAKYLFARTFRYSYLKRSKGTANEKQDFHSEQIEQNISLIKEQIKTHKKTYI